MADENEEVTTTYGVTIYTGANVTSASASPSSSIETGTEVSLTIACATGYDPVITVLAGGVTVASNKFEMGEADVALYITAKKKNTYRVLEHCTANINGALTSLDRNVTVVYAANGQIKDAVTGEKVITDASVIEALLNAGLIEAV